MALFSRFSLAGAALLATFTMFVAPIAAQTYPTGPTASL